MNRKRLALLTAACVLVFVLGVTLVMFAIGSTRTVIVDTDEPADSQGTVFYVDASAEKENYDGTSPEQPLKTLEQVNALELVPGDTVLFRKDCRWTGSLHIKTSGTEDAPITFGMYGEGQSKPCIDGAGIVNAVIWGEDISFVEIRNLEVTNAGDEKSYHRGISIIAVNENVEGITIKDCYVHDVDSCVDEVVSTVPTTFTDKHWYGGIVVRARSNANPGDYNIILKDILVEGNEVDRCSLLGIAVGGAMTSFEKDAKCQEIVIRGNQVSNCWGDGIILFNGEGGLIEHNIAANNGQSDDMTMAYAGIWVIWSDDTIIQYNESYGQGESRDGQGFDIDGGCTGTIVQYNYSHDNAGGFLLLLQWEASDAIVRYNISVNDERSFITHAFTKTDGLLMRVNVYNNTFFTTKPLEAAIVFDSTEVPQTVYSYYRNNIFCAKNGDSSNFVSLSSFNCFAVENNCYYGFSDASLPWVGGSELMIEDPQFAFVGSAGKGFDSLDGYKLLASSPCLNTGIEIFNHGGLDFWGNEINEEESLNIGAYMGGPAKRPEGVNIALMQQADISSFNGIPVLKNQMVAALVDGETDVAVSTKSSDAQDTEEWFEIAFDDVYDISKVILTPSDDGSGYPVNFTVEVCDEDGKWVEVLKKKNCKPPKDGESQTYTFDKVSTDKIRICVSKLRETDGSYFVALSEIEVY